MSESMQDLGVAVLMPPPETVRVLVPSPLGPLAVELTGQAASRLTIAPPARGAGRRARLSRPPADGGRPASQTKRLTIEDQIDRGLTAGLGVHVLGDRLAPRTHGLDAVRAGVDQQTVGQLRDLRPGAD